MAPGWSPEEECHNNISYMHVSCFWHIAMALFNGLSVHVSFRVIAIGGLVMTSGLRYNIYSKVQSSR